MNTEIFRTNIKNEQQANYLLCLLRKNISDAFINFDLKRSNPLLTIETNRDVSGIVYSLFTDQGIYCQKI
ncbi:hypothetical protein [Abyssalbus ytuae]|uniref:Uncharacterized protein n=1 Tax=Abyssalbus ytuae TaxID=2926907 RepID=A0A9E6ZLF9_9FLAO|nr:hypothetical protein [Abyssalbus ytuae]UOB17954.1 hypothetical protein MQE35_01325 [Abyssalbus ytuae]